MSECKISIIVPDTMLKGAGIFNTSFVPSYIYNIKIELTNTSSSFKLCSLSATLGNGIRYLNNLKHSGPDESLLAKTNIVKPTLEINNNNVIIFMNNFILSPNSINILSFDVALSDRLTANSLENSGEKIPHKAKVYFYGHLINEGDVDSNSCFSLAQDYELFIKCDDEFIEDGETTKFFIYCNAGQYDMVRSVYVRSILDSGLEFIADSCNLEPRNVYTQNGKTILKWDMGSLLPSESKRIGYKVRLNNKLISEEQSQLKISVNSNCVNNSTYTQCPASAHYYLNVKKKQ